MPKLHYSNRLDRLIGPLAQNLELEDPFEKAEIVVPNFSLQKWISLQLAQRQHLQRVVQHQSPQYSQTFETG